MRNEGWAHLDVWHWLFMYEQHKVSLCGLGINQTWPINIKVLHCWTDGPLHCLCSSKDIGILKISTTWPDKTEKLTNVNFPNLTRHERSISLFCNSEMASNKQYYVKSKQYTKICLWKHFGLDHFGEMPLSQSVREGRLSILIRIYSLEVQSAVYTTALKSVRWHVLNHLADFCG